MEKRASPSMGLFLHPGGAMEMIQVLLIEDDQQLGRIISSYLQERGYGVHLARTGEEGLQLGRHVQPDVVLLDILLPDTDGRRLYEQLREFLQAPVLFLSVLGSEAEVIRGLALGADAYLVKPFSLLEMEARIRALLRRTSGSHEGLRPYRDGYLTIEPHRHFVEVAGQRVELSRLEFKFLLHLYAHQGRAVSRQELAEALWGQSPRHSYQYLAIYMNHLRKKIERNPRRPQYLLTERGVGYRFQGRLESGDG